MFKIIYNEDGTIKDYSDEGLEKEKIESEIDLYYLIKGLPPKHQQIAKMLSEGYTRREIMKKLKVGQHTIESTIKRLQNGLKSV